MIKIEKSAAPKPRARSAKSLLAQHLPQWDSKPDKSN